VSRHIQFTRAQLLIKRERYEEAEDALNVAHRMSMEAQDPLLSALVLIEQGRLYVRRSDFDATISALIDVGDRVHLMPAYIFGKYQALVRDAAREFSEDASDYDARAARMFSSLRHLEALAELKPDANIGHTRRSPSSVVNSISALFSFYRHAEFAAREMASTL